MNYDNDNLNILQKVIELEEYQQRNLLNEEYKSFSKIIKHQLTNMINKEKDKIIYLNKQMMEFCKTFSSIVYSAQNNLKALKNITFKLGGHWLIFLLLHKPFHNKLITLIPSQLSASKSKKINMIRTFVMFLSTLNILKINTMSRRTDYIDTYVTLNNITKNVRFYYTFPHYNFDISYITCNITCNMICESNPGFNINMLDALYRSHVNSDNTDEITNLTQMDLNQRQTYANSLEEIELFNSNSIPIIGLQPNMLYNDECCIDQEKIIGPLIEFDCKHKISVSNLISHITYRGVSHSSCPVCRKPIRIKNYNFNDYIEQLEINDNTWHNDNLRTYFMDIDQINTSENLNVYITANINEVPNNPTDNTRNTDTNIDTDTYSDTDSDTDTYSDTDSDTNSDSDSDSEVDN